jgi:hypothetical protein
LSQPASSPAREATILGMALEAGEGDPICTAQPLCGMVVVKALDEHGDLVYLTGATEGLTSVECLGMARFAAVKLEAVLGRRLGNED